MKATGTSAPNLLYGPLAARRRRVRESGLLGELVHASGDLLRMGAVAVTDEGFREGMALARIQEHVMRYLGPDDLPEARAVALEIAVALSTPDLPDAYVTSRRLEPVTCSTCDVDIAERRRFLESREESGSRTICMPCVESLAGMIAGCEGSIEYSLRWIQHRLTELGRLPRE